MRIGDFLDDVFFTTVRVVTSNPTTGQSSVGTGFLISIHADVAKKSRMVLLVSNRHVLDNGLSKISLTFHKRKDDAILPDLGKTFVIEEDDFSRLCIHHPDRNIDLSCMNISALTAAELGLFFAELPETIIYKDTDKALYPSQEVYFVGYPDNRFDAAHNLPILRRGYIASMPDVDFNGDAQFIVDAPVFPGSSGSPVFARTPNEFKLIGIITATMVKDEQLRPITSTAISSFGIQQVIGLGIVIKVRALRDLISIALDDAMKTPP